LLEVSCQTAEPIYLKFGMQNRFHLESVIGHVPLTSKVKIKVKVKKSPEGGGIR
jgi:hypothetical protein